MIAERSNYTVHYIIQIYQDGVVQYLFNTRMLVQDVSLAKPFSTPASFIIQEQRKKYNICVWELLKNGLPYGMMPCI